MAVSFGDGDELCKTPAYIAPECLNLIVGIVFLVAVWRLSSVLNEKVEKMRR